MVKSPALKDAMAYLRESNHKPFRGSVLILVIIVFSSLATFGGILLSMVYSRFIYYEMEADRTRALYLAEAGISYSVWELKMKQDPDKNGLGNVARHELGGGYFKVSHNPETREIISTGSYNDMERTVAIIYESN